MEQTKLPRSFQGLVVGDSAKSSNDPSDSYVYFGGLTNGMVRRNRNARWARWGPVEEFLNLDIQSRQPVDCLGKREYRKQ